MSRFVFDRRRSFTIGITVDIEFRLLYVYLGAFGVASFHFGSSYMEQNNAD